MSSKRNSLFRQQYLFLNFTWIFVQITDPYLLICSNFSSIHSKYAHLNLNQINRYTRTPHISIISCCSSLSAKLGKTRTKNIHQFHMIKMIAHEILISSIHQLFELNKKSVIWVHSSGEKNPKISLKKITIFVSIIKSMKISRS